MKKTTTILKILLISILILSCSKKSNEETILILGTSKIFPPFAYTDEVKNIPAGFDIELAKEIAKTRGSRLEIIVMDFDKLIEAVATGEVDMALSGMSITEERKNRINFSLSYYEASQVALVRDDDRDSFIDIHSKEALGKNKKIASLSGSTGALVADSIAEAEAHPVVLEKSWDLAIDRLLNEEIDVVILDKAVAKIFTSTHENLFITPIEFEREHYGVAVAKENRELLASINDTIGKLVNSGQYIYLVEDNINSYFTK